MPFDINCPNCSRLLRVPDDGAGKHVKCPQCQTVVLAPKPGSAPTVGSSATADMWQVKGADGQSYGPVPRSELDQWCREGRLIASTQVLRAGSSQWQWASDLYPQLAQTTPGGGTGGPTSPFGTASPGPGYAPIPGGQVNPYAPGGYAAGAYPQNMSDKSKIAAGLLGIFLGAYGIHRFYLGDATTGVLQILVTIVTCGIGGIWGFIEGIMILAGSIDRDAMGRKLRD